MTDRNREVGRIIRRGLESGVLSKIGKTIHLALIAENYEQAEEWFDALEELCAPRAVNWSGSPTEQGCSVED